MGVLGFVLALVILGPLAKALADRISRGQPDSRGGADLRKVLQANEQRLAETESRLAAVEERLDFYEKLLANPVRRETDRPAAPADS
ncbi:MAG: hypothetical protein ACRENP_15305 [Longimicrobiales bacterium]